MDVPKSQSTETSTSATRPTIILFIGGAGVQTLLKTDVKETRKTDLSDSLSTLKSDLSRDQNHTSRGGENIW
jgi:hypothetical protein